MAKRVARIYGGRPIVNTYEYDENPESVTVKRFHAPTRAWAMFVINNRDSAVDKSSTDDNNFDNRYDIVIDPVANDDFALLFRQFSGGIISVGTLIHEMEFKRLTDQYSFNKKAAVALLRKVDEYIVKG